MGEERPVRRQGHTRHHLLKRSAQAPADECATRLKRASKVTCAPKQAKRVPNLTPCSSPQCEIKDEIRTIPAAFNFCS